MRTKSAEDNSLFKYKTRTHVISTEVEDEVKEGVVRQLFPVYDSEFEELSIDSAVEGAVNEDMKGRDEDDIQVEGEDVCQFTSEEMEEVSCLHQLLLTSNSSTNSHQEHLFMERYSLASSLAGFISQLPGMSYIYIYILDLGYREG